MTCVLIAQALIFQDGGLLALGANIFNMAIIGVLSAYGIYRLCIWLLGSERKGRLTGCFLGAWLSVVMAAAAASLELAFSGVSPLAVVLPAMAGVHALIGIAEGVISVAVVSLVLAVRIDLLELQKV